MSDSIITQCPNCVTTFRVSDDVLKMAKGKVRCGQCFHIFAAHPFENNTLASTIKRPQVADNTQRKSAEAIATTQPTSEPPEWLNSLVEEEKRLKKDDQETLTPYQKRVLSEQKQRQTQTVEKKERLDNASTEKQSAPWEIELAELEAVQNSKPDKKPEIKHKENRNLVKSVTSSAALMKNLDTKPVADTSSPAIQPEYMHALEQLAQSGGNDEGFVDQHIQYQKDAQQKLSELIEDDTELTKTPLPTKRHNGLWFSGCLIVMALLAIQLLSFNFEAGSRSATFRPVYKIVCTYYGCRLPTFEDVSRIDVQYVRVQSHPTQSNALLVNAIMTNTSSFSQPMPKIAVEFFDLNGNPVAARLFSQNNFLDKDFLDITYMPPHTPIHLVIPIADPGAAAVTHQVTAHRASTRSF